LIGDYNTVVRFLLCATSGKTYFNHINNVSGFRFKFISNTSD
jgi:hypothetical protein